jgi:hypothetical protein
MCAEIVNCECQTAVMRAYQELTNKNVPDLSAFKSAAALYRIHHPEASEGEARFAIAEWLDASPEV